jgi:hypothetical protein
MTSTSGAKAYDRRVDSLRPLAISEVPISHEMARPVEVPRTRAAARSASV